MRIVLLTAAALTLGSAMPAVAASFAEMGLVPARDAQGTTTRTLAGAPAGDAVRFGTPHAKPDRFGTAPRVYDADRHVDDDIFANDAAIDHLAPPADDEHPMPAARGLGHLPEPATWAMMIVGFGGIGFAMRRIVGASEARFNARIRRIAEGDEG